MLERVLVRLLSCTMKWTPVPIETGGIGSRRY